MKAFASWLTAPTKGTAWAVLKYAAIVTMFAAATQIFASWIEDDIYVYFFYEGAGEDFRDMPLFSAIALVAFPFGEELVFRGPLAWVRHRWGAGRPLAWSCVALAVVFGLEHGALLPQAVSAVLFSAVFLKTLETGAGFWISIFASGLTHFASNATLALMQLAWNGLLVPRL